MKVILIVFSCLSLAAIGLAEQQDNAKKKRPNHPQQQGQQTQQVQTGKPGKGGHHAAANGGQANAGQINTAHARHHQGAQQNANAQINNAHNGKLQVKHFNVANGPNPKIETVKFKENNRIVGAENWKGEHYNAFRLYHAEWHDHAWWRAHHSRIVLIGGGWYFWNSGFWYPAWGYDPGQAYYPYDGPIYAYNNLPPDQVVANVQESLQQQGYYQGEVDGLLGPLTRAALADYQRDHGLYTTSAIDQPTMESLGFA